ncbi:hypothetical protein AB0C13_05200 [Streptomyces sp. NPDC049099]|uniref:hypothetical protein n=1 Tax=Streptomyces sp. NPDC049099 TaxID=3155768 RepID=UPI003415F962
MTHNPEPAHAPIIIVHDEAADLLNLARAGRSLCGTSTVTVAELRRLAAEMRARAAHLGARSEAAR